MRLGNVFWFSQCARDDGLSTKVESFGVDEGGELTLQHLGQRNSLSSSDLEADQRRRDKVYNEILQSYDELRIWSQGLEEAKSKILRYSVCLVLNRLHYVILLFVGMPKFCFK